jgi:hypothetical protein
VLLAVVLLSSCGSEPASTVAPAAATTAATAAAGRAQADDRGDTGGSANCANVMAVTAWHGNIRFGHGRDVGTEQHVAYQTIVDVSANLQESYRNENAAGFAASALTGNVSISSEEHSHGEDYHRVDRNFSGEGPPAEGSRMSFNVLPDCSYGFYLIGGVAGSGTSFGDAFEGVNGFSPLKGEFEGASLNIGGTFDFPVYHPSDIEASVDKPVWFAEAYDVADILAGTDLGTVSVSWSFTPAQ